MPLRTKRVYDPSEPSDDYRLLVMRRWPRGIRKEAVDQWEKELGPSLALLQRWRKSQIPWEEASVEYAREVKAKGKLLREVRALADKGTVTLLCSCREEARCHRSLLKALVENLGSS